MLVIELGDKDVDLLATNAVRVHEGLRYPGHRPALGIEITWRPLEGHDRHVRSCRRGNLRRGLGAEQALRIETC